MDKADALRALIAKVEGGAYPWEGWFLDVQGIGLDGYEFQKSMHGDLNQVAALEAPLRERGWKQSTTSATTYVVGLWAPEADWHSLEPTVKGVAPTEARARLLCVFRALLHEASHDQ